MSLAVWLGAERKCSATVVGLDMLLGLSMVRRCSLNRSLQKPFCIDQTRAVNCSRNWLTGGSPWEILSPGEALNKVLYGEAPPRRRNPYPFIHHF